MRGLPLRAPAPPVGSLEALVTVQVSHSSRWDAKPRTFFAFAFEAPRNFFRTYLISSEQSLQDPEQANVKFAIRRDGERNPAREHGREHSPAETPFMLRSA